MVTKRPRKIKVVEATLDHTSPTRFENDAEDIMESDDNTMIASKIRVSKIKGSQSSVTANQLSFNQSVKNVSPFVLSAGASR